MSDPLLLFREAADALYRGDWRAVAGLCDPASLASFKRQQIEMIEPAEPRAELTIEQYMRHDPDMPREVAEYQLARVARHRDPASHLQRELPGIDSTQALHEAAPADVFIAWLRGRSPRHQIESLVRDGHAVGTFMAQFAGDADHPLRLVAIGAIADGERMAHVLFRHEAAMQPPEPDDETADWLRRLPPGERELARDLGATAHPQVATCRRQPDGEWRLVAGHDFLGLGSFVFTMGHDDPDERPPDPDTEG